MIRRVLPNRTFIALWCLAAAAGCARLTDEAANGAAKAEHGAVLTEPAVAAAAPAEQQTLDPALVTAVAPAADTQEALDDSPVAIETQLPAPSAPSAEAVAPTVFHPPVVASAAPATDEPEVGPDLVAPPVAESLAADTLDLTSLLTRLRKTKAINLRTKLAVKSESDDLLEGFRVYHAHRDTTTLSELRRSYDSLFLKLHSLLEDGDPPLARDIDRSRGAIWAILADPTTFGPSALSASTRGEPRA